MYKSGTPQNNAQRGQRAQSPHMSLDGSQKIMENISFLNRNSKFLSYADKDKLINLIKAQDPNIESLLSYLRDTNASKDEFKNSLIAFMYPKQGSKKQNESPYLTQSTHHINPQRLSLGDYKPPRTPGVTAVKLDLGIGDGKKAERTPSSRGSSSEQINFPNRAGRTATNLKAQRIPSQESHGKITSPGTAESGIRGRSIEDSRGAGTAERKTPSKGLAGSKNKISIITNIGKATPGDMRPQNLSARGQNSAAKKSMEKVAHSFSTNSPHMDFSSVPSTSTRGEFEDGKGNFFLPAGVKIKKEASSPVRKDTSKGLSLALGQERPKSFTSKTQTGAGAQGKSASKGKRPEHDQKHKEVIDIHHSNKKGSVKLSLVTNAARQSGQKQKGQSPSELNRSHSMDKKVQRDRSHEIEHETKHASVERKSDQFRAGMRRSDVNEKTKEVFQALLGDIGNGELLHNIMTKLEENAHRVVHAEQEHFSHKIEKMEKMEKMEQGRGFGNAFGHKAGRETPVEIRSSTPDMLVVHDLVASKKDHHHHHQKEEKVKSHAKVVLSLVNDAEPQQQPKPKTEKYVSVNMIKRMLDSRSIYTEDIVDEVFGMSGENVVNKNYFSQVMNNFLKDLPHEHGVQTQDIVNKMFEICDRNGDGLVSLNDLGSGATLFSQYRPVISRERRLYRLFDPNNRGFIIETDIVSILTKVNVSSGSRIFEGGSEEIIDVTKRLMKELDKENKGIITYWDIFLWKDTHMFSDLVTKLEKYTSTFNSAKKSHVTESSSIHHEIQKEIYNPVLNVKKSPVPINLDLPPLDPIYSTGHHSNHATIKPVTPTVDHHHHHHHLGSSQPGSYTVSAESVAPLLAMNNNPVVINQDVPSSILYTYQSPTNQDIIQNLSAFDSLTKEMKVRDMIGSGTLETKGYFTDLTFSPQSKPYTPVKDFLSSEITPVRNLLEHKDTEMTGRSSHAAEEVKHHGHFQIDKPKGSIDYLVSNVYVTEPLHQNKYASTGTEKKIELSTAYKGLDSFSYTPEVKSYMYNQPTDLKAYDSYTHHHEGSEAKKSAINAQENYYSSSLANYASNPITHLAHTEPTYLIKSVEEEKPYSFNQVLDPQLYNTSPLSEHKNLSHHDIRLSPENNPNVRAAYGIRSFEEVLAKKQMQVDNKASGVALEDPSHSLNTRRSAQGNDFQHLYSEPSGRDNFIKESYIVEHDKYNKPSFENYLSEPTLKVSYVEKPVADYRTSYDSDFQYGNLEAKHNNYGLLHDLSNLKQSGYVNTTKEDNSRAAQGLSFEDYAGWNSNTQKRHEIHNAPVTPIEGSDHEHEHEHEGLFDEQDQVYEDEYEEEYEENGHGHSYY